MKLRVERHVQRLAALHSLPVVAEQTTDGFGRDIVGVAEREHPETAWGERSFAGRNRLGERRHERGGLGGSGTGGRQVDAWKGGGDQSGGGDGKDRFLGDALCRSR